MTKKTNIYILKYTVYFFIIILCYILQQTPKLFSIMDIKPLILVNVAVCIAIFEGEFVGGLLGALAGILCDIGGMTIIGFNGIIMLTLCVICGLFIIFWLKQNIISTFLLCGSVLFIRGSLEYLACIYMWGYDNIGDYYFNITIKSMIYSFITIPIFFFAIKKLHFVFEEKLKD